MDYLERAQALSVEAELLLQELEHEDGEGWLRLEQARIHCDIAHLALISHVNNHGCGAPDRGR